MNDEWDFYAARVDDQPASIFVDLGACREAPVDALPWMAYIRLHMNHPRPDGLSSSEEFDALASIEEALEKDLCGDAVRYVGRNTSNGCRDFYFYTAVPEAWETQVSRVLSVFDGYRFEAGTRQDADWSTYFNVLFPGPLERQTIANRPVCDALAQHGDRLVDAREIDHWIGFADPASADAYVQDVAALGFQVRETVRGGADGSEVFVRVWRQDVPSNQHIDPVTLALSEAASRHGGSYDGWECGVVA